MFQSKIKIFYCAEFVLMLLLEKEHIAEVQSSSWEEKTYEELKDMKIL